MRNGQGLIGVRGCGELRISVQELACGSRRLNDSGGFSVAQPQLNLSFNLAQRETLRAISAQPEIFNCFVFCVKIFCVEAKKSASIQTHQRLGALRIGTLRDHESVAAASYFRRRSFVLCRL